VPRDPFLQRDYLKNLIYYPRASDTRSKIPRYKELSTRYEDDPND
jgi:hypothetical protein